MKIGTSLDNFYEAHYEVHYRAIIMRDCKTLCGALLALCGGVFDIFVISTLNSNFKYQVNLKTYL
jgi:hypothetical protein